MKKKINVLLCKLIIKILIISSSAHYHIYVGERLCEKNNKLKEGWVQFKDVNLELGLIEFVHIQSVYLHHLNRYYYLTPFQLMRYMSLRVIMQGVFYKMKIMKAGKE